MNKTVIFTLTNHPCNIKSDDKNNFFGIGDIIRGMVCVYNICKKFKYNFIIDIQHHQISKYLIQNHHMFESFIFSVKNKIQYIKNCENYIKNNKNNIVYLLTTDHYNNNWSNEKWDTNVDNECKNIIKNIFIPNIFFKKYINHKIEKMNLKNYSVIHFRLGDDFLIRNKINQSIISNACKIYSKYKKDNLILLSDSIHLKNILKKKENAIIFDTKLTHFGFKDHEINIIDTLFEYIILLRADNILYWSPYGWRSGFVRSASLINNIKLKHIL